MQKRRTKVVQIFGASPGSLIRQCRYYSISYYSSWAADGPFTPLSRILFHKHDYQLRTHKL